MLRFIANILIRNTIISFFILYSIQTEQRTSSEGLPRRTFYPSENVSDCTSSSLLTFCLHENRCLATENHCQSSLSSIADYEPLSKNVCEAMIFYSQQLFGIANNNYKTFEVLFRQSKSLLKIIWSTVSLEQIITKNHLEYYFVGANHYSESFEVLFRWSKSLLRIICSIVSLEQIITQNHLQYCFVRANHYSESFVILFRWSKSLLRIICTIILLERIIVETFLQLLFGLPEYKG